MVAQQMNCGLRLTLPGLGKLPQPSLVTYLRYFGTPQYSMLRNHLDPNALLGLLP
jgi:hypothetical protein